MIPEPEIMSLWDIPTKPPNQSVSSGGLGTMIFNEKIPCDFWKKKIWVLNLMSTEMLGQGRLGTPLCPRNPSSHNPGSLKNGVYLQ